MTSVTISNLCCDMPIPSTTTTFDFVGTARKRILIFIKGVASGQQDKLTDYVPDLAGIEGVVYCTIEDAVGCGSHPTWSGVDLTYPNKSGVVLEMCVLGRLK